MAGLDRMHVHSHFRELRTTKLASLRRQRRTTEPAASIDSMFELSWTAETGRTPASLHHAGPWPGWAKPGWHAELCWASSGQAEPGRARPDGRPAWSGAAWPGSAWPSAG